MKKKYSTQEGRIVELDDDEFLHYPYNARLSLVDTIDKKEVKKKPIDKMTKDELNDYGAKIGLIELNSYMTKDEMIQKIKQYEGE